MGWNPLKIITSGVSELVGKVTGLLDEVITSDDERNATKERLAAILADFESKLIDQVTELFKAQRDIIVAEAQGESWLQRNWRPIAMLTFLYIVVHMIVLTPILGLPTIRPELIPEQLWELLKIGIGGYIVGRTVEKGVRDYVNRDRE